MRPDERRRPAHTDREGPGSVSDPGAGRAAGRVRAVDDPAIGEHRIDRFDENQVAPAAVTGSSNGYKH
jgi:hypothetical protein